MKSQYYILSLVILFLLYIPSTAQQSTTAIVGGTLINTDGSDPIENSVIIIEDSIIANAGSMGEITIPENAHIVEADGLWIIPGLIDSHIHFFQSGGLYTRPDIIDLRSVVTYEEEELQMIRDNLDDTFARYLRSGVTSVVDVGGPMWNFEVRNKARASDAAPRVLVAGPLISTYQPDELTTDDPPIIEVAAPDEARELVREQAEMDADLIKIWYIVTRGRTVEDSLPIVEAVIDESRQYGIRVSVHATQLETARAAVKTGADILVHSVTDRLVDEKFITLLRENEVIYTPTLTVFERYPQVFNQEFTLTIPEFRYAHPDIVASLFDLRGLPEGELPSWIVERMRNPQPLQDDRPDLQNLKALHDGGVIIAAGTDAGNIGTPHGPAIFREFALMAQAGLSPMEILVTATRNGAKLMGMEEQLGTVTSGKLADLVILNSNPLEDIMNASDIEKVISNGTVFSPEELIPQSPENVVKQQVNAYNARDTEAFVSFYHPDATVYSFPDEVLASGYDEIYERYKQRFDEAPELHANITNRIVLGNIVIDEELITGIPGFEELEAVVIYEVEGDYIVNSWIIVEG